MTLSLQQKQRLVHDGYLVVPGVIAPWLVARAVQWINHQLGEAGGAPSGSDAGAIVGLFHDTPAKTIVESLVGPSYHAVTSGQIALRHPTFQDPPPPAHAHLDGMLNLAKGVVNNFTALVGVLLSDLPVENGGNFTVWPGTHQQYADYFRTHGPDVLLTEPDFQTLHRSPNVALPEPVQITGNAGDLIICNYQLIHTAWPNTWHHIRYASFFRVEHTDVRKDWRAPLVEPWLHWPGLREVVAVDSPASSLQLP